MPTIIYVLNILLNFLTVAIIARVILSWVVPMLGMRPHPILVSITTLVFQITEPILAPIRRVVPTIGMLDLSPMVALIILLIIRKALVSQL